MTKGYKKVAPVIEDVSKNGHMVITTSKGKKVTVVGVSHMYFQRVQNSVEFPDKPTYDAETAGGAIEHHPIDQTVVDDPSNTPEEKAEYAAKLAKYNVDYAAAQSIQSERINNFLFANGLEIDIPLEELEEWIAELEFNGLQLPKSKIEQKFMYICSRWKYG